MRSKSIDLKCMVHQLCGSFHHQPTAWQQQASEMGKSKFMKITQILGILFLIGLVIGLSKKLSASLAFTHDSPLAVFSILAALVLLGLGFRKVIRD